MRFLLALALLTSAFAQPPAAQPKARPEPKNLKILKPGPDLIPTMRAYAAALGKKCDFCHVQGDFASDANPHKEIARTMIVLTNEVNAKFPDGKAHVSCYTCHRGEEHPAMTAPADPAKPAEPPKP